MRIKFDETHFLTTIMSNSPIALVFFSSVSSFSFLSKYNSNMNILLTSYILSSFGA